MEDSSRVSWKGQDLSVWNAQLKYKCSVIPVVLIALLSRQCQFCGRSRRLSSWHVKGSCKCGVLPEKQVLKPMPITLQTHRTDAESLGGQWRIIAH